MQVNHMLAQCLESTMYHSLSKVEPWSIWKKELQSAYMDTKLYQFGFAWNLVNNLESVEN
jgi:hypothetical protein